MRIKNREQSRSSSNVCIAQIDSVVSKVVPVCNFALQFCLLVLVKLKLNSPVNFSVKYIHYKDIWKFEYGTTILTDQIDIFLAKCKVCVEIQLVGISTRDFYVPNSSIFCENGPKKQIYLIWKYISSSQMVTNRVVQMALCSNADLTSRTSKDFSKSIFLHFGLQKVPWEFMTEPMS